MTGRRWLVCVLLLGLLTGCVPGGVGKEGELAYTALLELALSPGESLPGSGIQYVEKVPDGARVLIGGQEAIRKVGDSLDWQSEPLDGVKVDLATRVLLFSEDRMHVGGAADITVANPAPVAGEPDTSSLVSYKAPVTYHVKRGEVIPGTTLTYVGATEQGAQLGNTDGYPYRKVADSILWQGRLRDRLHARLDLRVILYTDDLLQVGGTASVWIGP